VTSLHQELLEAIGASQIEKAKRLTRTGIDLNVPCDQGTSVLFAAILSGDVSLVRLMLEHGVDPNFVAEEPGATIYAEKSLELAEGACFLLDRHRYRPIVELLNQFGATGFDESTPSAADS
jgi:ankyrin repeat protein